MKYDIKSFQFDAITTKEDIPKFFKHYNIHWDWFGPQFLAALANYDLYEYSDGTIDAGTTADNLDDRGRGMLMICTNSRSGTVIPGKKIKWSDAEYSHYCGMVPLFLAAYKKHAGIGYNRWAPASGVVMGDDGVLSTPSWKDSGNKRWAGLSRVVEESLFLGMRYRYDVPSAEERINYLNWLSTREPRLATTPASCYNLWKPAEPPQKTFSAEMYNAPHMAKHMYLQTWVCYPTVRNNYMILDPTDWDNVPKPLISQDIWKGPASSPPKKKPWE